MSFGPKGIKLKLTAATPTPFTTATLKAQMEEIGLNCSQLTESFLQQSITNVRSQMPNGLTQVFGGIQRFPPNYSRSASSAAATVFSSRDSGGDPPIGNWTPDSSAEGYSPNLEIIQYPDHFDWLYANRSTNGFTGVKDDPPPYGGNYSNADSIERLFVNVAVTASATLVKGIDSPAMQAAFTNIIQPLKDADLSNYDVTDSRTFFLVDNYNASTGVADAVGVLRVGWHLKITDYKRKSKDGGDTHPTSLTINSASVLYGDAGALCSNYNAVVKQFGLSDAPPCS